MGTELMAGGRGYLIDLFLQNARANLDPSQKKEFEILWDSADPEFQQKVVQIVRTYTAGGD